MENLPVYFSSVSDSNDMDNFLRKVNFVYNSIVALGERIAALFVAFERFATIGMKSEVINVLF